MFDAEGSLNAWRGTSNAEMSGAMLAMRGASPAVGGALQEAHFNALAQACVLSQTMATDMVHEWRLAGVEVDEIYLVGITETAQLMGQWWCEDLLDFATATLSFYRLHQLLYELSPYFFEHASQEGQGLSCFMVGEFGGQHTLGLFMLTEFFRRDGWRVRSDECEDGRDLLRIVASDWFDVLTLSISTDRQLDLFRRLMPFIRKQSANPNLRIMAGGPMASWRPEAMKVLGVDVVDKDAKRALEKALALMGRAI